MHLRTYKLVRSKAAHPTKLKLKRIEKLVGVPIHLISTGPDRKDTIILQNPF